jgi:hypothetical protein
MMLMVKIMILTPVISNLMPPEHETGDLQRNYTQILRQSDTHQIWSIHQTAVAFSKHFPNLYFRIKKDTFMNI